MSSPRLQSAVIRRERLRLLPEAAQAAQAPGGTAAAGAGPVPSPEPAAAPPSPAEVDRLLAQARARAEEEGRRVGYQEGLRAGRAEGERQAREAAAALAQQVLEGAEREIRQRWAEAEGALGQLALEIASHLLGVAIRLDPDLVVRSVRELVAQAQEQGVVEVAVAPEDLPAVQALRGEWAAGWAGEAEVRLRVDGELMPGECRVVTREGGLERAWPRRLAELSEAFAQAARAYWQAPASAAGGGGGDG